MVAKRRKQPAAAARFVLAACSLVAATAADAQGAAASQPAPPAPPFALPASFEGELPCADCAGVQWRVDLLPDRSFALRMTYRGKRPPNAVDRIGRWSLATSEPPTLRLFSGSEPDEQFQIVDTRTLRKLDLTGRPIASKLNYSLRRLATAKPIEPRLTLDGSYSSVDDSGSLTPCATGQRLPVATEGAGAALEATYAVVRQFTAEPVLVTAEARLVRRPATPGEGPRTHVAVVERVLGFWPGESCPDPDARPALVGSYWRLTRLPGIALKRLPPEREAHLVLTAEGRRFAGASGCNRYAGTYDLKSGSLDLGRAGATMMACEDGMDLEQAYLDALGRVASWRIRAQHLDLFDADGAFLARHQAAEPPARSIPLPVK